VRANARAARIEDRIQARQNRGNVQRTGNIISLARPAAAGAAIGAAFAARHATRANWQHDWRRRNRSAYGWYGPMYWPYAYDSIFADVFLPYDDGYDTFWDYGYGDIYAGLFNPYGYDDLLTTQAPPGDRRYVAAPPPGSSETTAAIRQLEPLCGDDSRDVAGVPVDDIQNAITPTDAQRTTLDDLGTASVKAAQIVKASCPSEIALTATGRLDNMKQRIEAMIEAVATVRQPLDTFYNSLSDEQKARFNAIGDRDQAKQEKQGRKPGGIAQVCGVTAATEWPAAQIERSVKPNADQSRQLDALRQATEGAAAQLKSSCPTNPAATPTERLTAIDTRLHAMLDAVNTVRKPLAEFYGTLNDAQKARFNAVGQRNARQG
jgi:hypothetical protein